MTQRAKLRPRRRDASSANQPVQHRIHTGERCGYLHITDLKPPEINIGESDLSATDIVPGSPAGFVDRPDDLQIIAQYGGFVVITDRRFVTWSDVPLTSGIIYTDKGRHAHVDEISKAMTRRRRPDGEQSPTEKFLRGILEDQPDDADVTGALDDIVMRERRRTEALPHHCKICERLRGEQGLS